MAVEMRLARRDRAGPLDVRATTPASAPCVAHEGVSRNGQIGMLGQLRQRPPAISISLMLGRGFFVRLRRIYCSLAAAIGAPADSGPRGMDWRTTVGGKTKGGRT